MMKQTGNKGKNCITASMRDHYQLWLLILPAIIVVFIFNYIPMYGVQLAFREYSFKTGIMGGKFVGLKYFLKYFNNPMFSTTLANTFRIAVNSIILGFPAPILLALILNQLRNAKYKRFMQTIVYMPHFISTVVLVAMIRIMFSSNTGLLTQFLKTIQLMPEKANPLGDPDAFVWLYVFTGIWQNAGWDSIIYLAAMSAIDSQLYEACKVDGANRLQIIWHIEIPSIIPTVIILLIMNAGNILSVGFEKVFLMQNNMNISASQVISTYVYSIGLKSNQFSYGAAIGLFNTVINFVFLVIVNLIANKVSNISLW